MATRLVRPVTTAATFGVGLLCCTFLAAGCGRKKDAADTPAKAAEAPAKPAAEAKPEPKTPPPPPPLGLDRDKFIEARLWQRCAEKHGATPADARAVAVRLLAGKRFEPLEPAADTPAKAAEAPAGDGKAPAAEPKGGEPGDKAPAAAVEEAKEANADRRKPLDEAELQVAAKLDAAIKVAPQHEGLNEAIDAKVADCMYHPRQGLITPEVVERYVKTFVDVACMQQEMRDDKGRLDPVAHARAAAEAFVKRGFTAASFRDLGVDLSGFARVQAAAHEARRGRCPDPREALAKEASNGRYVGRVTGKRKGELTFKASSGKVEGTLSLKGDERSFKLQGVVGAQGANLFTRDGMDFLRFVASRDSKGRLKGTWSGELGHKKVKGTWTYERPPTPKPAPKAAATPPAAAPSAAAP
jgi:hypothetical protein